MDMDNIECVSTDEMLMMEDDDLINHHHHSNAFPANLFNNHQNLSKPHHKNNNNDGSNNINGALLGLTPATSVHELLECPVCTNSMYPPIHQVFFSPPLFDSVYICVL